MATNETKIKKAAENYPELVDAGADWVEIPWDEYNTDLKNAFVAGAQFVLDHVCIENGFVKLITN